VLRLQRAHETAAALFLLAVDFLWCALRSSPSARGSNLIRSSMAENSSKASLELEA